MSHDKLCPMSKPSPLTQDDGFIHPPCAFCDLISKAVARTREQVAREIEGLEMPYIGGDSVDYYEPKNIFDFVKSKAAEIARGGR